MESRQICDVRMTKDLSIVFQNYKILKDYIVDKTLMIQEFLDRKSIVTLITRPRRFGKTLNMSMMAEFFDVTKDSKELFKDTQIMKTEYASQINQYPTIFISFANAKGDALSIARIIKKNFLNLYQINQKVFDNLDRFDKPIFENIMDDLTKLNNNDLDCIDDALSFLMKQMERYYGKKVMVFIDEYDTPFIEAHVQGFYEEIRNHLSNMLHNALKISTSLQYAMLTGIQRVAKENIFSGLNNLVVCTVKDDEYAEYFGFSVDETKSLLEYYDLSLNDTVKRMYDGYRFGNREIYNPWSLIHYAYRRKLDFYWINTSSNKMIKKAMSTRDRSFNQGYEKLIQTGFLETIVRMETSFFEVGTTASLWGLFINAGYLTIKDTISTIDGRYVISIPNQEVYQEFRSLTAYYLNVSETDLSDLFNALLYDDREEFEEKYKNILLKIPSYHDLKDESSYHTLFLGMYAWLSYRYEIISNKEVGKGRCDIILKAKEDITSYVLEFKYLNSNNLVTKEQLKKASREAIDQIEAKQYGINLTGHVIYIGLAHYKKEVEIEWKYAK